MPERTPVGLVGLGLMGRAVAKRIRAAGYAVVGFDRDPAAVRAVSDLGGTPAASPADVARDADVIVLSLPDHLTVAAVVNEMVPSLRAGHVIIDTSTGDPEAAETIGAFLATRHVTYLDAAVSGNSDQLARGDVLVMAGGDLAAFESGRPLLAAFARDAVHCGPCGAGARMKLVTNLVLGLNRAALAEGLAFAGAVGVDLASALAVLKRSAAYSRIMDVKGEKMATGDFTPQARLSQHAKDVRLMLAASPIPLPLSETHATLLAKAEALGYGDADNAAIIQALTTP
jgi:3-hydroxyisobutyrate dehydrogenase-like beta-hydroxyacid dehydrogenase